MDGKGIPGSIKLKLIFVTWCKISAELAPGINTLNKFLEYSKRTLNKKSCHTYLFVNEGRVL